MPQSGSVGGSTRAQPYQAAFPTTILQTLPFSLGPHQYSLMPLHLATPAARKVLDAAPRGFKGIMNYQLKIGVRRLGLCVGRGSRFSIYGSPVDRNGHALHDNFLPRQSQINSNMQGLAFLMVTVRNLYCHATRGDAVVESFEFLGLCANPALHLSGMLHVAKCDLQRKRHGLLP